MYNGSTVPQTKPTANLRRKPNAKQTNVSGAAA
jgi:hypothetical protein